MSHPVVSVIIVAYNNEASIGPCLDSLVQHMSMAWEAVIVDNSPDSLTSRSIMHFQAGNPGAAVRLVQPGSNLGFACGCNTGARQALGDYFMFLNPDTCLSTDAAAGLIDCLQRCATRAVAGPQMLDGNGCVTKTCRNLPTPGRILLDMTGLDRMVGGYRLLHFSHTESRAVEQVIGACFFMHRSIFERFHGFDEQFFVYFEEVDYCTRARDTGLRVLFSPTPAVRHYGGVSAAQAADAMFAVYLDSLLRYQRKHLPPAAARLFGSVFKILFVPKLLLEIAGLALKIGKNRLRGKPDKVARDQAQLRGRTHFLTGGLWRFLLRA